MPFNTMLSRYAIAPPVLKCKAYFLYSVALEYTARMQVNAPVVLNAPERYF